MSGRRRETQRTELPRRAEANPADGKYTWFSLLFHKRSIRRSAHLEAWYTALTIDVWAVQALRHATLLQRRGKRALYIYLGADGVGVDVNVGGW